MLHLASATICYSLSLFLVTMWVSEKKKEIFGGFLGSCFWKKQRKKRNNKEIELALNLQIISHDLKPKNAKRYVTPNVLNIRSRSFDTALLF